jgi:hypothetical protein
MILFAQRTVLRNGNKMIILIFFEQLILSRKISNTNLHVRPWEYAVVSTRWVLCHPHSRLTGASLRLGSVCLSNTVYVVWGHMWRTEARGENMAICADLKTVVFTLLSTAPTLLSNDGPLIHHMSVSSEGESLVLLNPWVPELTYSSVPWGTWADAVSL